MLDLDRAIGFSGSKKWGVRGARSLKDGEGIMDPFTGQHLEKNGEPRGELHPSPNADLWAQRVKPGEEIRSST